MIISIILSLALCAIAAFCYRWFDKHFNYWKYSNVPYIPSTSPIFGNIKDILFWRKSPAEVLQCLYNDKATKDAPAVGFQLCYQPALLVRDLDLIKRILVKDFNYFSNRHSSSDPHSDTLGSSNLFFVKNPIWRQIRNHISPIFTSGKMRQFFHLVNNVGENLDKYLLEIPVDANSKALSQDVKEISALFTTDIVASVAYGIDANSFKNPNGEFRKNGRHIFNFTLWRAFEFHTFFFLPQLITFFRCKVFSKESTKFLRDTFHYIIEEREKSKQPRNDLIDLLIELRRTTKLQIDNKEVKFDGDLLVSQAAIFFTAGYETTSTTMSFGLYELSKNTEIQDRLRQEIKEVLEKNNGKITYDVIVNMRYLHMVIYEILRMYPPLPMLDRRVDIPAGKTKGYSLEPFYDVTLPDKMPVYIPIYALQRDEKYFPEPEKFDPERFASENKDNIIPYTYMPFGTGSRICIGERFGLMQSKIGLFNFLKNHYVRLSPRTRPVMKLEEKALTLQSAGGIYCDITRDPLVK